MTTIAYKDGILAADSQVQQDGIIVDYTEKITSIQRQQAANIHLGAAGELGVISKVIDHMRGRVVIEENLQDEIDVLDFDGLTVGSSHFEFIIVWGDAVYTMDNSLMPLKATKKTLAVGTGAQIALGAMHQGASAEEAVKIACELDIYSGGNVKTLSVEGL